MTESNEEPAFEDDGSVAGEGLIIGTYLHGIFENENFREAFLDYLYRRKGLDRSPGRKGDGFDELASAVEAHLDMARIWGMLEIKPEG